MVNKNPADSGPAHSEPHAPAASGWRVVSSGDPAPASGVGDDPQAGGKDTDGQDAVANEGNEGWHDADAVVADPPVANADPSDADAATDTAPVARRTSDTVLVLLGICGGVYLLYTLGWIMSARRFSDFYATSSSGGILGDVMMQATIWLSIAAPAAWFASVFALTASSRTWVRMAWLLLGAVLLVPLPFLFPQMVIG